MSVTSRYVQDKTGDVYVLRWDTDPDHEGGLMLDRIIRRHDETREAAMLRAYDLVTFGEDVDAYLIVSKDVVADLAREMAEFARDWPTTP